jgi:hypothetical protein
VQLILNADNRGSPKSFCHECIRPVHTHDVPIPGGTHFKDFPIDEFDTLFVSKETRFSHFENVVGREEFSSGFHSHILFSIPVANQSF